MGFKNAYSPGLTPMHKATLKKYGLKWENNGEGAAIDERLKSLT